MSEMNRYSPEEIVYLFGLDQEPSLKVKVFNYLAHYGNYLTALQSGDTPTAVKSLAFASDEERAMTDMPPQTLDVIVKRFFGL